MNLVSSLRTLLRVYSASEPEAFRVAEQFGIGEMPAALLRPPRLQRNEAAEERVLT